LSQILENVETIDLIAFWNHLNYLNVALSLDTTFALCLSGSLVQSDGSNSIEWADTAYLEAHKDTYTAKGCN
jgi:hypothetical protein